MGLVGFLASFAVVTGLLIHHRAEIFSCQNRQSQHSPMSPGVNSVGVNRIEISLIEVDEEDHIISEASNSVGSGHRDYKGKKVVYKCVECLVHKSSPRIRNMRL